MNDNIEPSSNPNKSKPPNQLQSPSLWWRLFFGLECAIIFLNILGVSFAPHIGVIEIIDFSITNLAFVGLCGFIYRRPIGSVVFWRYFFYVVLVEALIVLLVFPIFSIPVYGTTMTIDWWFFNISNTCIMLLALNLYAYKYPAIWQLSRQ